MCGFVSVCIGIGSSSNKFYFVTVIFGLLRLDQDELGSSHWTGEISFQPLQVEANRSVGFFFADLGIRRLWGLQDGERFLLQKFFLLRQSSRTRKFNFHTHWLCNYFSKKCHLFIDLCTNRKQVHGEVQGQRSSISRRVLCWFVLGTQGMLALARQDGGLLYRGSTIS